MTSQVVLSCNKDARIADNGSSLGAGASTRNPIGLHQDLVYLYRTLLSFPVSFAGMTSITSAYLKVKTSDQYYCAFGSDPDFKVRRLLASWSEGTAVSMSGSNAVEWTGQPSAGTSYVFCTPSEAENTWGTFDVTALIREAFTAGVFYGFRLEGNNEASHNDMTEIWTRESGNGTPTLTINYETNVGPNPPVNLQNTNSISPTFQFDHSDNDGDALGRYDIQLSTDSSFASVTHWNAVGATSGISGNHVTVGYSGNALSRGGTYYWRVRTRSATGVLTDSGWTNGAGFYVNQLPTVAFVTPNAENALCQMYKIAGDGVNPRLYIDWTFSDPEGGSQSAYQVNVVNDNGSAFWDSGYQGGSTSAVVVPVDAVRGAFYKVTVTVWDSAGESATTGQRRCKAQWSLAEYRIDLLGTVTAWSTSALSSAPANTAVVTEYGSSAGGGATGWYSSIASAPLGRWFHYRVWLFAWSGAASPSFSRMSLTYTNSAGVPPDGWTVDSSFAIDTSTRVYGTQSLRATCNSVEHLSYQTVPVQKHTDYILSGRIKSDGNSQAKLQIVNAAHTVVVAETAGIAATQDFVRGQTPIWNSGDADACIIRLQVTGAAPAKAWFDALKLEASRVVTSWNPGMVGHGVALDAGGIRVDASPGAGATLRLQGSAGQPRDTVALGPHGLVFGGDTELSSPAPGKIAINGVNIN